MQDGGERGLREALIDDGYDGRLLSVRHRVKILVLSDYFNLWLTFEPN